MTTFVLFSDPACVQMGSKGEEIIFSLNFSDTSNCDVAFVLSLISNDFTH